MFDQFYQSIITPIFFVETLADLGKPPDARRPPDQIVSGLAERTPVCFSALNEGHWSLIVDSLAGQPMPLDYRPMVPGGIPVQVEGKRGIVYEKAPETEAFERWQRRQFAGVERYAATIWRNALKSIDLPSIAQMFRAQLRKEDRPSNLDDAKSLAQRLINAEGMNFRSIQIAFDIFNVPSTLRRRLIERWKSGGRKHLKIWAPYAGHCLKVTLFFYVAISNGLISDQRPSNLIDMAYLFYLPFARVFVSNDKLHRRVVPLFLTNDQTFVWGPDLKADLKKADNHFASLPDEEKAKGLFLLANKPPEEAALICEHWNQYMGKWRTRKPVPTPKVDSAINKEIIQRSNAFIAAAAARNLAAAPREEDLEHLIIQRFIPRSRGKWRMFSKEVEEADDERRSGKPGT